MLLPVSSYIAIRAEDHDDRAEKDCAKEEEDDDKGAVTLFNHCSSRTKM